MQNQRNARSKIQPKESATQINRIRKDQRDQSLRDIEALTFARDRGSERERSERETRFRMSPRALNRGVWS